MVEIEQAVDLCEDMSSRAWLGLRNDQGREAGEDPLNAAGYAARC